jgi:hypothetical protein
MKQAALEMPKSRQNAEVAVGYNKVTFAVTFRLGFESGR